MFVLFAPMAPRNAFWRWSKPSTWFWTLTGRKGLEVSSSCASTLRKPTDPYPDNPIPRPVPISELECDVTKPYNSHDSCYPLKTAEEPSWSLEEVFGRPLKGACPLTPGSGDESQTVCINTPPEREVQVRTAGNYVEKSYESGSVRCYKPPSKGIKISSLSHGADNPARSW